MHLERVSQRTNELSAAVGPVDTMVALARLEDALAALEVVADCEVIDLREARTVTERTAPAVARAEERIGHLAALLEGN